MLETATRGLDHLHGHLRLPKQDEGMHAQISARVEMGSQGCYHPIGGHPQMAPGLWDIQ